MSILLRSTFDVELVEYMGSDELMCKAARVSTLGAASIQSQESEGLLNFLMKNRHGSPFEHAALMFRITQPIAMWREFMRHRIGFSYNEESARYMELSPEFYIPNQERNLAQIGKVGHYTLVPGSDYQYEVMRRSLKKAYNEAWDSYKRQLDAGVAKEVARFCLPVATYSTAYVTCNPRSLMSFLSLRTKDDRSKFPSYPQYEINEVANQMEAIFADKFPSTHKVFNLSGRVSP